MLRRNATLAKFAGSSALDIELERKEAGKTPEKRQTSNRKASKVHCIS